MLPVIEVDGFVLSTHRLMMVIGHVVPLLLFRKQCRAGVLGEEHKNLWLPLSVAGIIAGQIGARVLSSGMTWHWGFLSAALAVGLVAWYARVPVFKVFDVLAPPVALGYAILRVGCFLAGEGSYGVATDLPWGMAFPEGYIPVSTPVHPVSLYESVALFCVFLVFWFLREKPKPKGFTFAIVAVLGGLERFFVEFLRMYPEVAWGLTAAQLVSLLLIITGIGVLIAQVLRRAPLPQREVVAR